jgi:ubiquinone/menaquinone biosynthesis C-methylase UbiE
MICHHDSSQFLCKANGFAIHRCLNCLLDFTYSRPSESSVVDKYKHETPANRTTFNQFRKTLKCKIRLRSIEKFAQVHGRVLDIGCSEGDWGAAVEGKVEWSYIGLELHSGLLRYALARGINVAHGTVQSHNFPDEDFALVIMTHVLEHMHDPRETLVEISRVLKTSGLVIIEVPDSSHPKAKRKKKQERWYGPPAHLWYFSQDNLHQLLKDTGFTPLLSKQTILKPYVWLIARKSDIGSGSQVSGKN